MNGRLEKKCVNEKWHKLNASNLYKLGWWRAWYRSETNWHVDFVRRECTNKYIHTRASYDLKDHFIHQWLDPHDRTWMETLTFLWWSMSSVCEFILHDEWKAQTCGILGAAGRWPPHCTRLVIVHQRAAGPRLTDLQYSWMPPKLPLFPQLIRPP
jgi:hypothetical protein